MNSFIVIGKGGREHALASLLAPHADVYSFGGSDAIREIAPPLDADLRVSLDTGLEDAALTALLQHPEAIRVFGPEQPMAAGWVDQLQQRQRDLPILGPNQFAAQLESSKWWAKEFMMRHRIPTGAAERIRAATDFDRFTLQFEPPYVIKADGLAAGKGVALFDAPGPARSFVEGILSGDLFGQPQTALIEEYLSGPELSIFLLLDGKCALQIGAARDYKRAYDNDEGPNTGGMGSFTPVPDLSSADQAEIDHTIIRPILDGLKRDGIFYKGFLYVGLMRTPRGFRVLEFNVRLGDPETQAVLPTLGAHLPVLLAGAAHGQLKDIGSCTPVADDLYRLSVDESAVCVVLSTPEYPESAPAPRPLPQLDALIAGRPADTYVFHAGTRRAGTEWETNGGRVLNVVATGKLLADARARCYKLVQQLSDSSGLRYRQDIANM
jgi:phosphoribosylamine---glycine ligase